MQRLNEVTGITDDERTRSLLMLSARDDGMDLREDEALWKSGMIFGPAIR